ncbi:MAG: hypothetical protein AAGA63_09370 [Pseudomonadota bacterium]
MPKSFSSKLGGSWVSYVAAAGAAIASIGSPHIAQANCEDYFEGQRFTLVVPNRAGGGYDTYARAFDPVFEEATGASLVVANMTGAGGAVGLSRIIDASAEDRVFGFFGMSTPVELPDIDADLFTPVVSVKREQDTWIAASDFDFEDALANGKLVTGTNRIRGAIVSAGMPSLALGVEMEILGGYDGTKVTQAAMLRGETDIDTLSATSGLRAAETGDFKIVTTLTKEPIEGVDAPTLSELVEERIMDASPEERQLRQTYLDVVTGLAQNMRAFWINSDMDPEASACISDAVQQIASSPEFKEAADAVNRPVDILFAAEAQEIYDDYKSAAAQSGTLIDELLPEFE